MKIRILTFILFAWSLLSLQAKDFYLTGAFNGWQPAQEAYKFKENNGVYTLFVKSIAGELKITTSKWEEQFGCASKISYGNTYNAQQSDNGYNISLPDSPAKNITITFDYNKKTLRFDKEEVFYLVGDFNNWLKLPAYAFSKEGDVYRLHSKSFKGKFKIVSDNENYSFSSGKEVTLNGEQLMTSQGVEMSFAGSSANNGNILIVFNPNSNLSETPSGEEGTENQVPEDNGNNDDVIEDEGNQSDPDTPDSSVTPDDEENNENTVPDIGDNSDDANTDLEEEEPSGPSDHDPGVDEGGNSGEEQPSLPEDNEGNIEDEDPAPGDNSQQPEDEGSENDPETENPDIEDAAIDAIYLEGNYTIEYFTLQGRKVINPSNGVFIRKQGNKTDKVIIR